MPKIQIKDPRICRMSGYHPVFPDEMDDVSDWAKEASKKILSTPNCIKDKINKIFKSR